MQRGPSTTAADEVCLGSTQKFDDCKVVRVFHGVVQCSQAILIGRGDICSSFQEQLHDCHISSLGSLKERKSHLQHTWAKRTRRARISICLQQGSDDGLGRLSDRLYKRAAVDLGALSQQSLDYSCLAWRCK